jgi:hypothetical protein
MPDPVTDFPVVYCAFEGGKGLGKRAEAWRRYHLQEDYDHVPFYLRPLRMEPVKEVDELIGAIEEQLSDTPPVKIGLDTLNRSMTGSESKDADMGAYLAAADKLGERFSSFVNILHHPGCDASRVRGHTSLPFGVEVELAVSSPDKLLSTIKVKKMKDEEVGLTLHSKLEKVCIGEDEDGLPITSLVV